MEEVGGKQRNDVIISELKKNLKRKVMGESDGEKNTLSQSGKLSLNKMRYLLMISKSHLPEKNKERVLS